MVAAPPLRTVTSAVRGGGARPGSFARERWCRCPHRRAAARDASRRSPARRRSAIGPPGRRIWAARLRRERRRRRGRRALPQRCGRDRYAARRARRRRTGRVVAGVVARGGRERAARPRTRPRGRRALVAARRWRSGHRTGRRRSEMTQRVAPGRRPRHASERCGARTRNAASGAMPRLRSMPPAPSHRAWDGRSSRFGTRPLRILMSTYLPMTSGFVALTTSRTPARRLRSNCSKRSSRVVRATDRLGQPRRRRRTGTVVRGGASTDDRVDASAP